jgi:AcrR family transcriptional regulator
LKARKSPASGIQRRRAAAAAGDSPAYLERQKAIRTAAGQVFAEKGFHAAKLSDVAERAGIDRASLYYYVGSKDDLFREVVSQAVAANVEEAEAIARQPGAASEKLFLLIRQLMVSFEREYPYLYVFVQEDTNKLRGDRSDDGWAETLALAERYFAIVKEVVADGIEAGDLRSELPPSVVAYSIVGMVNSSRQWFRPNGLLSASEIGAGLARVVLDGLCGTP